MIRAIIVDDESINISNLKALLARHCKSVEIVASAENADEAKKLILKLNPDVLFLDIEMPEKNGFDLLRSIENPEFEVIFVTAHETYGIMAVKFSAFDYLLKPINTEELKNAVERVTILVQEKKQNTRLSHLLEILDKKQPEENPKIALPTQKETYLVPIKEIIRCESSNSYTTFYLTNGTEYLISKALYEYDELLSPYGFIRCHQSHLINKAHVVSILHEDSGYLVLNHTKNKIPISKQRKAIVKSLLK